MKCILLIGALLAMTASADEAPGTDQVSKNLFPPELIIQHREDIGLDEAQSKSLKDSVQQAQSRFLDLQWDMQAETGKFVHLLHAPRIDEAAALAQADKVLAIETAVKKAQLSLLIRIKNLLTPEQQQKLEQLRKSGP